MTESTRDWRKWIRGFVVVDVVISIKCIVFAAYSLLYLYKRGIINDSKAAAILWAMFVAALAYVFVLIIQIWLSFRLLKWTSLGIAHCVTLIWSRQWRDFNLFHVGCCVLFICLESIWTPVDCTLKLVIICLILFRLACYAVADFFIKDIQRKDLLPKTLTEVDTFSGCGCGVIPPGSLSCSGELKPAIRGIV